MVKIIERGTRRKRGTRRIQICDNCGCKFSFEAEDIVTKTDEGYGSRLYREYVTCPQCNNEVVLVSLREEQNNDHTRNV